MIALQILAQYRWRPSIGDPSVVGWLTVAAYAVAAWLALSVAFQTVPGDAVNRARRRLWLGVAGLMAFLCLNKQLDLQTLVTDIGRFIATDQGWYEQRGGVQKGFVLAVVTVSVFASVWFAWRFRAFWTRNKLLIFGLELLLTFIVVRAISFHHFDIINQSRFFGFRLNSVLELGGIALVSLAAVNARRAWQRPRETASTAPCREPAGPPRHRIEFVPSGDLPDAQARALASALNDLSRGKRR